MRFFLLFTLLFSSFLWAEVRNVSANTDIVKSGITIIDIRTEPEWKETGLVQKSVPITFFQPNGSYDAVAFLNELNKHVSKDKEFAVICRTGHRSTAVSDFLSQQGYKVVNLQGGISRLISQGYQTEPYRP